MLELGKQNFLITLDIKGNNALTRKALKIPNPILIIGMKKKVRNLILRTLRIVKILVRKFSPNSEPKPTLRLSNFLLQMVLLLLIPQKELTNTFG